MADYYFSIIFKFEKVYPNVVYDEALEMDIPNGYNIDESDYTLKKKQYGGDNDIYGPAIKFNYIINQDELQLLDDEQLYVPIIVNDGYNYTLESEDGEYNYIGKTLKKNSGQQLYGIAGAFAKLLASDYPPDEYKSLLEEFVLDDNYSDLEFYMNFAPVELIENEAELPFNFFGNMNCVLKEFINQIEINSTTEIKKIKKEFSYLTNKGAAKNEIIELCKYFKCNCKVRDILDNIWFEYKLYDHKKCINIISHNQHASNLSLQDMYKNKFIIMDFNDLHSILIDLNISIKLPIYEKVSHKLIGIVTPGVIYKDYNLIFGDEKEKYMNMIKENPEYNFCFNKYSIQYKKFKSEFGLNDQFLSEDIMNICKSANYNTQSICFEKEYKGDYFGYDQNNAYPTSFLNNKYYEQFLFPTHINAPYYTNDKTVINKSGFTLICNIIGLPKIFQLFYPIYNNRWYSNLILKYILDLGGDFDIEATCFSYRKTKLDFKLPEKPSVDDKIMANRMIGKMLENKQSRDIEVVLNNINEYEHFHFLYQKQIKHFNKEKLTITINETNNSLKGLYHIHAYILDYQAIMMLDKLIQIPIDDILKIKCDCIYTKKNYNELFGLSDELHRNKIWKHENEYKYVNGYYIDNINYNSDKSYNAKIEYELDNILIGDKFIILIGYGGGGKSYFIKNKNISNIAYCFPTKKLRDTFGKKNVFTYQVLFDIGTKNTSHFYNNYSVIFLDEISMIPYTDILKIIKICKDNGIKLIMAGDDNQLQPVQNKNYFKIMKEFKGEDKFDIIRFDTMYRQKDDKIKKYIKDIIEFGIHINMDIPNYTWSEAQLEFSNNDIFISYTNERINNWNWMNNSSTVHKYQGQTIEESKKLFIDLHLIDNEPELFYTAITRVQYYSQLVFVRH